MTFSPRLDQCRRENLSDLVILDVGHGNCAVLHDEKVVIVIDAALGDILLEFIEERGITEIDSIILSHADADHIGGVIALLCHPHLKVHKIYLNPDAQKDTEMFKDLRYALSDARKRSTDAHIGLTTTTSKEFDWEKLRLEVLSPPPEIAASGSGGTDLRGRKLTSNTMSAVIRVVKDGKGEVLFTGDLDAVGLEMLLSEQVELQARLLVFPHHGGRPGRQDAYAFARRICQKVQPEFVIFSIGRGKHDTPRPEIINGVRDAAPNAYIACTQLSNRCASELSSTLPIHLGDLPARGRHTNTCCAGTIELNLGSRSLMQKPRRDAHRAFVQSEAPTAMCLRQASGKR